MIPGKATTSDGLGRHEHRSLRVAASNGYRVPLGGAELQATLHELAPDASEAERIVRSLEVAVQRHGYREYYNPLTGRGLAARGFGFATLLIDLLAECGIGGSEPSGRARIMQA